MSCTAYDKQVIIRGLKNLNRAVHEDVVAIEIFPKSQWVRQFIELKYFMCFDVKQYNLPTYTPHRIQDETI